MRKEIKNCSSCPFFFYSPGGGQWRTRDICQCTCGRAFLFPESFDIYKNISEDCPLKTEEITLFVKKPAI